MTGPTSEELLARADAKRLERAGALEDYKNAANRIHFESGKMLQAKTAHEMEVSLSYLMRYFGEAMAALKDYEVAHKYLEDRGVR